MTGITHNVNELHVRDGQGVWRPATREEIISAARTALARRVRRGTLMSSPQAARDYLTLKLGERDHEVVAALFLDTRHRLIEYCDCFAARSTAPPSIRARS